MLTVKQLIAEALKEAACGLKAEVAVEVSWPANSQFGDYSSNLAMPLAKSLKRDPMEVAEELAGKLNAKESLKGLIEKIEAVKPGFINFHLSSEYLSRKASEILHLKGEYGRLDFGNGKSVQIEFISANPTGPLTVGNGRGGFYGDVLANILTACGFKVAREYLVNDAGNQIEALGHSVLKDDQAVYQGEYIDQLHERLKQETPAYLAGEKAAKIILNEMIKKTVEEKMKIKFDVWFSETKELRKTKEVDKILDWLKKEKLVYEKDGAWWFKSSEYGDNRDRVLVKSDGEFTYLAQDFAYLKNKFGQRKFDRVINIWGADHHGDVQALLNAAQVLGYPGQQEIILMQFVKLFQNGQEVRMSKRKGTYVTMDELIEAVGAETARFSLLMYSSNTHIDFDIDKAKEKSDKNPVYYVQYAYARICGILKQAETAKTGQLALLEKSELELARELVKWPEIISDISLDYQVQKLTAYAINLADKFHQFYTNCRVIDRGEINASRVGLVKLSQKILREVLDMIGVSSPEKM